MMFKTILFGGFLFATVCAAEKPWIATLDVQPNLDQSLTRKDFRVHYSGAGVEGSSATIKIYKDDVEFKSFQVEASDVNQPKAYYFGYNDAASGEYAVEVCVDSECSGKSPALTSIKAVNKKVSCEKGSHDGSGWVKKGVIELEVIGTDTWLEKSQISAFDRISPSEWTKNNVESNPSFKQSERLLYAGVSFDVGHYRKFFITKDNKGEATEYVEEFCGRKYLLSYHVHILQKDTKEVKHRFKKTLYLSPKGMEYLIVKNTATEKAQRRQVHVELVSNAKELEQLRQGTEYQVWVSFCATEKDENESTICSDPFVGDLNFE